jgi:integrase
VGVLVQPDKHKPGRWWVRINHRGQRKSLAFRSKRAAEIAAIKIDAALKLGQVDVFTPAAPPTHVLTLAEYAETWLPTLGTRVRASTAEDYAIRLRVRILPFLGPVPLTEITRERVRGFLRELAARGNQRVTEGQPLARATLKGTLHVLSALLGRAVEEGLLPSNPAARLAREIAAPTASEVDEVEVFTPEELSALLAVADRDYPVWHPFILCLARSGVRLGEATGLEWRDVDSERRVLIIRRTERRGRVSVPKSGKARRVDMSRQLVRALVSLKSLQEAEAVLAGRGAPTRVFLMPDGAPVHDDTFRNHVWTPILRRAGLRYRKPHTLRHTYASLLIEAGESLKYVQEQLGHHSPAFTLGVYGHLIPRGDRRAVDRLDDVTTERNPGASDARERVETPENIDAVSELTL